MMNDEKIIKNMLEEAWNNFVKYYDKKALGYSKSIKSREKAKDSHWICWNESDLMVQLGRYFYILLKNNKSISDIEMHFDKFLNSANFGDYIFNFLFRTLDKNYKVFFHQTVVHQTNPSNKSNRWILTPFFLMIGEPFQI